MERLLQSNMHRNTNDLAMKEPKKEKELKKCMIGGKLHQQQQEVYQKGKIIEIAVKITEKITVKQQT